MPWKDVGILLAEGGDPHMLRKGDVAEGTYYESSLMAGEMA